MGDRTVSEDTDTKSMTKIMINRQYAIMRINDPVLCVRDNIPDQPYYLGFAGKRKYWFPKDQDKSILKFSDEQSAEMVAYALLQKVNEIQLEDRYEIVNYG